MTSYLLPAADISWGGADGADRATPRSNRFDDIYFSPADGAAESRHVFLDGIGAPEVWANAERFIIAETGFGTGLNFLLTWARFRETAAPEARLTYVSAEAFPLRVDDLRVALGHWPDLAAHADQLIDAWPHALRGFHSLEFDNGRVRLLLLFGDAAGMFAELHVGSGVDAWYLDGFAPDRNPDMWSPKLFQEMARLSKPGTVAASFTVAGIVRRGLKEQGFDIEKRPGFGRKRECLRAVCREPLFIADAKPWFHPPAPSRPKSVAVRGGGIAGLVAASSLCRAGFAPVLYERAGQLLAGASGNPVAILEPWVDLGNSPASTLARAANLHALRFYERHAGDAFVRCGVRVIGEDPARLHAIVASDMLPGDKMVMEGESLLFRSGGMIDTRALAAKLAGNLDIRLNAVPDHLPDHEAVILAASFGSEALAGVSLGLLARRGQITLLPACAEVPSVLSGDGYVTPVFNWQGEGWHLAGASFAPANPAEDNWRDVKADDRAANLARFVCMAKPAVMPDAAKIVDRVGLRATTVDHLPVMGGVPVADFAADYAGYSAGRRNGFQNARYQQGLYALTALGSRGYLTAPLLADSLVALMTGDAVPLPRTVLDALHPARMLMRSLRRQVSQN